MKQPTPLILDGQPLVEPLPTGLDLANFIQALAASQKYDLTIVIDADFPRQKPELVRNLPAVKWHRLDFSPGLGQAGTTAERDQRQQALNRWVAGQGLIGQPFVVTDPVSRHHYPTWPSHSYKICLWPNLQPASRDNLRHLDLIATSDLVTAPTKTIADDLIATGLITADRVAVIGQGGLSCQSLQPSAPNPRPMGDFVLWPIAADEANTGQLTAVAWQIFRKQTGRDLDLVVVGNLNPSQKAKIRGQVGRRAFFGQNLTIERLAWLYATAAAILLVRPRPGRLTPLVAAVAAGRPIIASPTADLQTIAPDIPHYCDATSMLAIARSIELALSTAIPPEQTKQRQQFGRDFNWQQTAVRFHQAQQRPRPRPINPQTTAALLGRGHLPPRGSGRAIGGYPASWAAGLQLDYFYEGQPLSQNDDNWLLASDRIQYRPLVELPGEQLERYQNRVYYLANHPNCYQTMIKALTHPGIVVAPSLRFDRIWRHLVSLGFISQQRWQLETQLEAQAGLDDDCRGAWSLIKRAPGLILDSASDCRAAKKIKRPASRIQLVSEKTDWAAVINQLQPPAKPSPVTYIDVSSLAHNWLQQPRLTGIQRCEYQLVTRARDTRPATQFVFWQAGAEALTVVASKTIDQLSRLIRDYQSGRQQQFSRHQSQLKRAFMATKHYLVANPGDRLLIPQGLWSNHPYAQTVSRLAGQITVYQLVHDLIPILYPDYVPPLSHQGFSSYLAQIVPSRPQFITVSQHTLDDLGDYHRRLGLPAPQGARTWRLGDNPTNQQQTSQEVPALVDQPFVLIVSSIEPHKNHRLVLEAYKLAAEAGQSLPTLCVVGRVGWLADQIVTELHDHPQVVVLHGANDRQLAWLYQNCRFTILPSLYEGWGLPVGESLAWGCPILCSRAASLPEVGGQLADYFDPDDPQGLLQLMLKYLNPATNQARRRKIKKLYQPRTWTASSDDLLTMIGAD